MIALQASIGALNDLVDAPRDAIANPRKPLPSGDVSPGAARVVALAGLVAGLGISAAVGPGVLAIALLGVGIGFLYDLRLKGTALAWLPFALGIPLLPVYAWYGVDAAIPSGFAILIPAAIAAGAALALGNQLADFERDGASGTGSTARRLGRDASWTAMALLETGVVAVALGSLAPLEATGPGIVVAAAGAFVIGLGTLAARRRIGAISARAWELHAVGVGLLAAGWVSSLAGTSALRT